MECDNSADIITSILESSLNLNVQELVQNLPENIEDEKDFQIKKLSSHKFPLWIDRAWPRSIGDRFQSSQTLKPLDQPLTYLHWLLWNCYTSYFTTNSASWYISPFPNSVGTKEAMSSSLKLLLHFNVIAQPPPLVADWSAVESGWADPHAKRVSRQKSQQKPNREQ